MKNPSQTEHYSVGANSWLPGPDLSVRRSALAAASTGHRLFVAGGWNGDKVFDTFEALDEVCTVGENNVDIWNKYESELLSEIQLIH